MSQPSPESIRKARENIMASLAEFHAIGQRAELDCKTVAAYAGYTNLSSKHVRTALKQLQDYGLIRKVKGQIEITDKGVESMPAQPASIPNNHAMQTKLLALLAKDTKGSNLPPIEKTVVVFNALLDGKVHDKKELAKSVGYAHDTKAFRNVIGRMKILGMLTGTSKVSLTNMVFPVEPRGESTELLSVPCDLTTAK